MSSFKINRAPVLTLWAAVVAERLGFDPDEALTLGRAVVGLTAYSKDMRLGIIEPAPKEIAEMRKKLEHGEHLTVALLGRAVPVVKTPAGIRALAEDKPDRRRPSSATSPRNSASTWTPRTVR